jgi:hypothetical protein
MMTVGVRSAGRLIAVLLTVLAGTAVAAQEMTCAPPPFDANPEIAGFVSEMDAVFDDYPLLRDLLDDTVHEVCLSGGLYAARGYFEPESGRIAIERTLPPALRRAVFVHELIHARQFGTGSCPSPDLSMSENVRAVFAMEADASAGSLVVAWTMRAAGDPGIWDALSSWPMQGDISRAFAAEMGASGDLGSAARAAFSQWYAHETRRDTYYVAICSQYLDAQDETHSLPRYGRLEPRFFARLCRLPDGGGYACDDGEAAKE